MSLKTKKNSLEVFHMLERSVASKKWKCNRINEKILHLDLNNQRLTWRMVKI